MKIELHCHSHYSKGSNIPWEALDSPRDIVRAGKKKRLTGLALTDHATIKGWKEAQKECKKNGILFIPGIEFETKKGHLLGLGLSESIKDNISLEETIDLIHQQAGIAVAAHPFDINRKGMGYNIKKVDAIEAFNGMSLDRLSNWFTERQAKKLGKPMVAGSDAHTIEMVGTSSNVVKADSLDEVLKAIKNGKVKMNKKYTNLSTLVDWTRERMCRSYSDVMDYINKNYWIPRAWISKKAINSFVNSKSRAWNVVADIGLGFTVVYSGFRLLSY